MTLRIYDNDDRGPRLWSQNATCDRCDGDGRDDDGEPCGECAGYGYVRSYEVGDALLRTLATARDAADLHELLTRHAAGCDQRELSLRRAGLTTYADAVSAESAAIKTTATALLCVLQRRPEPHRAPTFRPINSAAVGIVSGLLRRLKTRMRLWRRRAA